MSEAKVFSCVMRLLLVSLLTGNDEWMLKQQNARLRFFGVFGLVFRNGQNEVFESE